MRSLDSVDLFEIKKSLERIADSLEFLITKLVKESNFNQEHIVKKLDDIDKTLKSMKSK